MANHRGGSLHSVLQSCNLLDYEPLLLEEGADDVCQLKELDEEEFRQLCLMVGMASKPFHVKRFQKALGRPSSQIYAALTGTTVAAPGKVPPATLPTNSGGPSRIIQTVPHVARPVSQLSVQTPAPPPLPTIPQLSSSHPENHYQYHQQPKTPKQPKKHQQRQQHDTTGGGYRPTGTISSDQKQQPTTKAATLTYQAHEQTSVTQATVTSPPPLPPSSSSRQLFLPHYLQPDSESKDVSSLVDETTPIQAELGPCPFKPSDWDERRSELVQRYSAIYGQGNSKRKNEELSLHEENINVAAYQLCLRDPTLLVRRDELLVLSRKAIKDGGYTFQHGLSKAKTTTETTGDSSSGAQKQPPEDGGLSMEDYAGLTPSEIAESLLPSPRNMSREKKLKRVEELEFLIAKNKTRQNVKLAALEKARQTNDFSTSHHLQAEIESLGSTLASLQEEYSNMKYRLRRSDRYFEKKSKKLEERDEQTVHRHHAASSSPSTHPHSTPKRIRLEESVGGDNERLMAGAINHHHHSLYLSSSGEQATTPQSMGHDPSPRYASAPTVTNSLRVNSYSTTTISDPLTIPHSRSFSQVPTSSLPGSSPLSHSPPPTTTTTSPPLSHPHSPPPLTSDTDIVLPLFSTHYPESSSPTASSCLTRPTVMAQILSNQDDNEGEEQGEGLSSSGGDLNGRDEDLSSNELLANINKLASQAAAKLRSLPQF